MNRKSFILLVIVSILFSGYGKSSEMNADSVKNVQTVAVEVEEKEAESKTVSEFIKEVTVEEVAELLTDNDKIIVLDVRTKGEYESGHIKGAVNISHRQLKERIDELEEYKDTPIIIYCRSGRRSGIAVEILKEEKFLKIYHMNQGISKWENELIK